MYLNNMNFHGKINPKHTRVASANIKTRETNNYFKDSRNSTEPTPVKRDMNYYYSIM